MLMKNKLIIISGPSCVGKSPLLKSLRANYPALFRNMDSLVLYNSRAPRPGEGEGRDYHFRSEKEVRALGRKPHILAMKVRNDFQAVDIDRLKADLKERSILFEGNPFIGEKLITHPAMRAVSKRSIFISPLTSEEIKAIQKKKRPSLKTVIFRIMYTKQLRRAARMEKELTPAVIRDLKTRARSAYRELGYAHTFQHIVVNHDGEDSENWSDFGIPLGDARRTMRTVAAILSGKNTNRAGSCRHGSSYPI